MLFDESLTNETVNLSLSGVSCTKDEVVYAMVDFCYFLQSVCSLFCFKYLSPQVKGTTLKSSLICEIGEYSTKVDELQCLAQYLWINANSPVYNVQYNQ